jgi:hypothetical protein
MRPRQVKTKTFTRYVASPLLRSYCAIAGAKRESFLRHILTKSPSCWTCRKRKLKCHGPKPTCQRCIRAGLVCEGFGIRLSWADSPGSPVAGGENQLSHRQRIVLPRGNLLISAFLAWHPLCISDLVILDTDDLVLV